MKKFLLFLLAVCYSFYTSAQRDTIIYLGLHNETVNANNLASSNYKVKFTNNKVVYTSSNYSEDYHFIYLNDSSIRVNSSRDYSFTIVYKKTTGGYLIRKINQKDVEYGFSKLIFPLIKEGTWVTIKDSVKTSEEYFSNNRLTGNKYWYDDGKCYTDVFALVDTPFEYDSGDINKFRIWVMQNVLYPEEAALKNISGKVIVQFIVTKEGKTDGVRILRGVHELLDREVIKVINNSPNKWKPAKIDGQDVNAFAVIPIIFQLQ